MANVDSQVGWVDALTRAHWRRLWLRVRRLATDIVFWLALGAVGLTMCFPLFWMVSTSFKTQPELFILPPPLLPSRFSWENYDRAFRFIPYWNMLVNSIVVTVITTLGRVVTSTFAGFAFARLRFPGRDQLFLLYLAVLMVPFPVTMIPLYLLMRAFGWLDTYQALILPPFVSAYNTFLVRQYMLTLPSELEDAARIDGANPPRIYWNVILPLCGPVIAAVTVFSFLNIWNSFIWPLMVISTRERMTLPIGLLLAGAGRGAVGEGVFVPWNIMMAVATAAALPMIIVYFLAQRHFVEGIALTGIKG